MTDLAWLDTPSTEAHIRRLIAAGGTDDEIWADIAPEAEFVGPRKIITRGKARAKGLRFYFTGAPCKRGHITRRYVSGHACAVCGLSDERKAAIRIRKAAQKKRDPETYSVAKREYEAAYKIRNRKAFNARHAAYRRNKRATDIDYKLKCRLRIRIWSAIKSGAKSGSAIRDLGCTVNDLLTYIAAKFYGGMSWDNWGAVWELDHIVALSLFDLNNREQFLRAAHYSNLQPLTISDHARKTAEDNKLIAAAKQQPPCAAPPT
jgi:hypothetical protein